MIQFLGLDADVKSIDDLGAQSSLDLGTKELSIQLHVPPETFSGCHWPSSSLPESSGESQEALLR